MVIFCYSTQQQTSSQLDCDVQWKVAFIWQPATTSSVFAQRKSSKALPKPNPFPKKGSWSLFGGLLLVWSTTAFWILVKHFIWEVCSASQWDAPKTETPATGLGQWKKPSSPPQQHLVTHQTTSASKVGQFGLWCFASSAIFTWALTSQLQLLQASWQLFAGKMFPQPTEGRKCFPRVHQILKHEILC